MWMHGYEVVNHGGRALIDIYKDELLQTLESDALLAAMVADISVKGRYKSRYSTMKKILKYARKPEDVNDVLGLRVILNPRPGDDALEVGEQACYRTRQIIQSMWKEIPHRTKDYIAKPKENGYRSLHMAVDVSDNGRATANGNTNKNNSNGQEKRLKTIMLAAAELAALRLRDLPSTNLKEIEMDQRNRAFCLLDKNGDGRISIEELTEVMEELGAPGEDAGEMMMLLDSSK